MLRLLKRKATPKQRVRLKYPKAVMNTAGYIQIPSGPGTARVIGRSWKEAADYVNRLSKTSDSLPRP
jgi:hypothetical protein